MKKRSKKSNRSNERSKNRSKTTKSIPIYDKARVSKNGGIKNKGFDPKNDQKCDQNHRKNDQNLENRSKATAYIYICCLYRFSRVYFNIFRPENGRSFLARDHRLRSVLGKE